MCDMHKGPEFLLVLVKSYAANIAQRLAIRQTWGNISNTHIKVIYLLGYYSVVQKMIDLESYTYKDVLQGHFFDIYDNNMNKTAMAYQYAVDHCFIIKNEQPFRNKSSKWYLSREEYPYDYFPTYHAGGAILISMTIAKLLKTAFPYVKYIHIDDVYLGIVAMKLDIPLQKEKRFDLSYTPPLRLKNVFASHGYRDHRQLLKAWDVFLATISINSFTDLNKQ
ncbi:BRN [Mytilus edulis]|uniref:Hexosyltransferase n=1 Tax=Mytilus edulis TaxID=6550 RepID=A0A8S3QAU5_MYTED|nr:BRN [Mytilus edulis]